MDREDFRWELNNEELIQGSYNSRIVKQKNKSDDCHPTPSAYLYTERTRASGFDRTVCHQTGYHANIVNMNTAHFLKKKGNYGSERRALTNNITSSTQKPGTWLALI